MLNTGFRRRGKPSNNQREPMFCRLNHSDGLSALDTIAENAKGRQGGRALAVISLAHPKFRDNLLGKQQKCTYYRSRGKG